MTEHMQQIRVTGKAARIRGATWTHDQVEKLLQVWIQPEIHRGLLYKKKKQEIFKNMAATLGTLGVSRSWTECRAKIKNLKADYRKALEGKISFRYFNEMREIMTLDYGSQEGRGAEQRQQQSHSEEGGEAGSEDDEIDAGYSMKEQFRAHSSFDSTMDVESVASTSSHYQRHHSPQDIISTSPYHQETPSPSHFQSASSQQYQSEESRSSSAITHVVSKVIEPVTTVIVPSASTSNIVAQGPIVEHEIDHGFHSEQPPIRLEFVLDDENLILQEPEKFPSQTDEVVYLHESSQTGSQPTEILKERLTRKTPSPFKPTEIPHPSPLKTPMRKPPALSPRKIIPPKKRKPFPTTPTKVTPPATVHIKEKKRKVMDSLNKKTVETILTLLTESSRSLLKELQDAEQRFLVWEEDKRAEERKREEAMFAKLIGAIQSSCFANVDDKADKDVTKKSDESFTKDFQDVSKRLNEMVTEEVKATEESVREWELKMQRQESRHTEKLFAMIVNAIKVPSVNY